MDSSQYGGLEKLDVLAFLLTYRLIEILKIFSIGRRVRVNDWKLEAMRAFAASNDVAGYVAARRSDAPVDDDVDVRFEPHSPSNGLWYAFLGLVAAGFVGLFFVGGFFGFCFSILIWAFAAYWLWWSWNNRQAYDSDMFAVVLFKDGVERRFCEMENKLMNLMEQSKNIPDRFRDGFVTVKCNELDERRVSFVVSVSDVVGAIEFIEQNADKWAAAFGDRDGADISILATNVYVLDFDLMGVAARDVEVEW